MQTRFRLLSMATVAMLFILSSCSKSNKQGRYIPNNAAVAVIINGESLSAKLPWEEVKQAPWHQMLANDSSIDAFVKAALDNPDNTGIDTKKDMVFFAVKDSIGGYMVFEGLIKDEATFKKFTANLMTGASVSEKEKINIMDNGKATLSWKDGRFVFAADAPMFKENTRFNEDDASTNTVDRNLFTVCQQVHSLKEDKSLAKDDKMTSLVKKKADVYFWMNTEALNTGALANPALSMLNLSKLTEGSFATGMVNFENGKIELDFKSYSGKDMTELSKKYSGSEINTEMISRIPAKDVAVFFSLNFKPEGVKEFLKLGGLDGFANMGMGFLGISVDDFVKANSGDIAFMLSDLRKDSIGAPDMNVMFTAGIGDKPSFDKLIAAGKKIGKEELRNSMDDKVFFNTDKKYFAIGNSKSNLDQFFSGNKSKFEFLDKLSGNPSGFYMNFKSILTLAGESASRDSLDNISFQATINMWENIIATGGKFKDGGVDQHIEINLFEKNINSLKALNKYLGILAENEQKKKARYASFDEPVTVEEAN